MNDFKVGDEVYHLGHKKIRYIVTSISDKFIQGFDMYGYAFFDEYYNFDDWHKTGRNYAEVASILAAAQSKDRKDED